MKIRDRVVGLIRVKASELRENPWNWRKHPEKQQEALRGILEEVGIAGALIARKLKDGTYVLIDGHLRKDTLPDQEVPVLVLDVTEREAKKLLAAYDPLSSLAETDDGKLKDLLRHVETGSKPLADLFSGLVGKATLKSTEGLELDIGDGETPEDEMNWEAPPSHVRMVQLFLNSETLPQFEEMVQELGQRYGTPNMTDTVLTALKEVSDVKSKKQPANGETEGKRRPARRGS